MSWADETCLDDDFWNDEGILSILTRTEQEEISKASLNPSQRPATTTSGYLENFSPPRELSQAPSSTTKFNYHDNNLIANVPKTNVSVIDLIDKEDEKEEQESETNRLKRELERVSEQLTNLQQECLELKKDRDQKEEQLKSASSLIDANGDEGQHLKNTNVYHIYQGSKEYETSLQDRLQIPPHLQIASTSIQQSVPEYRSCETKGVKRTSGSRGTSSKWLPLDATSVLESLDDPSSAHHESHVAGRRNNHGDGSGSTDLRRRILIGNASATSNECSNQKFVLPETSAQSKVSRAVGVQTDTVDNCSYLGTEIDLHSEHDLRKELLAIWAPQSSQRLGRSLVSKLFVACAADFYTLFRCMGMSMPPNISLDYLANKSFPDVVLHEKTQNLQSVEAAKVAHLYFLLTKISNEMVQLDIFIEALLDLCALENVFMYSACTLAIHAELGYKNRPKCTLLRDNVVVEGISPQDNSVNFLDTGANFGFTRSKSSFTADASSSMISLKFDILGNKEHNGNASTISSLDLFSLFEKIHCIVMAHKEESIQVEAVSIMNLIVVRSDPCLEREKFGSKLLFQTAARLLQKDVALHVRKQAVRLLFLLLNCPKLSAMFCSGCNEGTCVGSPSNNTGGASTFQVFSNILEGLAECVKCRGHGTQELKLRRLAIIVLAFIASSGKSGFEVILNSIKSERFNFLGLIVQTLATEMDAEEVEPAELTENCKERASLAREALILLNRVASNPAYSAAALASLTTSRDIASLTVDVLNRMSKKGMGRVKSPSVKKRKTDDEISDLARALRSRVFAFLGDSIP